MAISQWVRLPSRWIDKGGLTKLVWRPCGDGSDNIAALMALTVIAHQASQENGIARVTYDQFCDYTFLSRSKLSNGLEVLKSINVIANRPQGERSTYQLVDFNPNQYWAKLPAKSMYSLGTITAFKDFQLRNQQN